MFTFNGGVFESHPVYRHIKSLFLDFFRGETTDLQDVAGLQHVISITAGDFEEGEPLPQVFFRVYTLKTFKSNQKVPRVELNEIGPRLDFAVGRYESPSPEMEKEALKKPKQLEAKTKKNVETDFLGDKIGRVHVGKQDLNLMQTRKMKGLKKRYDQVDEDFDDQVYGEEEPASKKLKQ
jgi:ribosome production factor 2